MRKFLESKLIIITSPKAKFRRKWILPDARMYRLLGASLMGLWLWPPLFWLNCLSIVGGGPSVKWKLRTSGRTYNSWSSTTTSTVGSVICSALRARDECDAVRKRLTIVLSRDRPPLGSRIRTDGLSVNELNDVASFVGSLLDIFSVLNSSKQLSFKQILRKSFVSYFNLYGNDSMTFYQLIVILIIIFIAVF